MREFQSLRNLPYSYKFWRWIKMIFFGKDFIWRAFKLMAMAILSLIWRVLVWRWKDFLQFFMLLINFIRKPLEEGQKR